ncbi:MAG: molybdopterin-dependent oxidoreductase, partial [Nitrospira sp.]|nr:molybdopterin-dependent oxidoreductase [Nitrospira sp.]
AFVKDETYFAIDKVRYVGDRIAAVAAVDEETTEEALELIEVEYELLPPVLDAVEALQEGSPLVHEDYAKYEKTPPIPNPKGNIIAHIHLEQGDVEKAFAEADYIFEDAYTAPMAHQAYLEPHASLAVVDPSGKISVWTTTQAAFVIRSGVAETLQVPMTQVRIIPTEIGGGFGGKIGHKLEVAAALLARKTRMPVQMVMTREEDFQVTSPRHPCHMIYKTGVKKDGTIIARKVRLVFDTGAYAFSGPYIANATTSRAIGPYRIPHFAVDSYCVWTNKSSCGAYRAPGSPKIVFALESQMDDIARKLGMDPVEIRLKNAIQDGDKSPTGMVLQNIHLKDTIQEATQVAEWGKQHETVGSKPGVKRGWGIATSHWFVGGLASSACVKINEDGTIGIITGAIDLTGSNTSLGQIVAEALGVNAEDVSIRTLDTDNAPHTALSAGSQLTRSVGMALVKAAEDVKKQMFEVAANQLEANVDDLELKDKKVYVKGVPDKAIPIKTLAQKCLMLKRGPLIGHGSVADMTPIPAFCTQIAEVEVDPETGEVKVLQVIAVQDVGVAINPQLVEGQIEGGIVQGIGYALTEELKYVDGKIRNAGFLDYKIPSSLDAPKIKTILIERMAHDGPFGMKGVG